MGPANAVIALRLAGRSDAGDLARLSDQLGYPMTPEAAESRLREALGGPDHALLVAESRGRIARWMELKRLRLFAARRQVEVVALVVDEENWGLGIGSRLLEEAEQWAADLRCGKIRIRSNTVRERAHSLYRRSGFEEISTGILFEKQLGPSRPKVAKFVPTSIASKGAPELPSYRQVSPLSIVRVAVAALLIIHGCFLVGSDGVSRFGDFLSTNHLPFGPALAWGITAVEIAGGLALAAGRFARSLCLWFAAELVAGIVLVDGREGWFVVESGPDGAEYSFCSSRACSPSPGDHLAAANVPQAP